jgi:hypothetical protein
LSASATVLSSGEGALVSVSISVNPRDLESLLEALAQVPFPVNPQIYHDAALIYRFSDGREEAVATTLVEFPAYEAHLGEARRALEAFGFDWESLRVTSMLAEIHEEHPAELAPAGAGYASCVRVKHRASTSA